MNEPLFTTTENLKKEKRFDLILFSVIAVIFVFFIVFTNFVMFTVQVSGSSMQPTLDGGEVLIVNRLLDVDRGDVIVFKKDGKRLIKRVIAVEGDVIYSENGKVYLKKQGSEEFIVLSETYVKTQTGQFSPVTVSQGKVFVLGDNRAISNDSRFFGTISLSDVVGVVEQSTIDSKDTITKFLGWTYSIW